MLPDLRLGGVQVLVATFVEACRDSDIASIVVALGGEPDTPIRARLEASGAGVAVLPAGKILDPLRFARLYRFFETSPVDVVHAHLPAANIVASLAGRITGKPVIGGLHLPGPLSGWRAGLRGRLEALALRAGARAVTACGPAVAENNRRRLGRLPIEVVANPALAAGGERAPNGLRRTLFPGRADPVFVVVGRLACEKGVDAVLQAAAGLRAELPDFAVLIVGDGPLRGELEADCRRLGLADRVRFLGARHDVPALLAASDVYVSGSWFEGMSLAMLEAMAQGLPVIATDVGDGRTLVDASTGVLVAPGDIAALAAAMRLLGADPSARAARGSAARRRACGHDPRAWCAQLADLYRRVARPGSDPRLMACTSPSYL
jgi:glycosyltransferase involved in cell wall biosynthesis